MFSKPQNGVAIPLGTLGYITSRNRSRLYTAIMREFRASGITKAELARRLRKGPEVISRMLSSPKNLTIDTAGQLVFAINGGELTHSVAYPFDAPPRNYIGQATQTPKQKEITKSDPVPNFSKQKPSSASAAGIVKVEFADAAV